MARKDSYMEGNHNEDNNKEYEELEEELEGGYSNQDSNSDLRRYRSRSNNGFLSGILTGIASCIIIAAVFFGIWSLFGHRISTAMGINSGSEVDYNQITNKLKLLEQYIDHNYLDEVDSSQFSEGIYKGLLSSLEDPYSAYYTKDEYTSLMESTSGIYYGIGAYVSQDTDTGAITIVKPFETGPAYEAGVLPGDIIYKVEDTEVTGMELSEVVNMMKGKEHTKVKMEVLRSGVNDPIPLEVERRKVEVPTITYEMLPDKVGYIAVAQFDEITATQFRAAIDDLEKQGMKGLVIDLRNNPGGLLTTVVDMLDRFVKEGMLVYTKDKYGEGEEFKAEDTTYFDKPLAVLINGNSASASEVFAGAIQDYGLGELVGTTSFGKGIVQNVYKLTDGSAVKLTVSKYYTPSGRNIHKTGIEPDVVVELNEDLKQQVTIEKAEDNQLQRAIEVVKEQMK